ncbi:uncharacterized protein LOC107272701 [Cephus cinctus]|uniref:Uncharacterized protein LOC107272701 n=1 Tax=Cephus cinctus TaxID=211228 RepID=A0AAJ7FS51_CEPCN|nr:uncharacterized protein LOC107272701 [Cephus cinctus]
MSVIRFLVWTMCCVTLGAAFNLEPYLSIARCKSSCISKYSIDGSCDSENSEELSCSKCWYNCESLLFEWDDTRDMCEKPNCIKFPECVNPCYYYKSQEPKSEYLPSMLPAPKSDKITLGRFDVGIVFKRMNVEWKKYEWFNSKTIPTLDLNSWIIVVTQSGVEHWSKINWSPSLVTLKEGPLYEATLTWKNPSNIFMQKLNHVKTMLNSETEIIHMDADYLSSEALKIVVKPTLSTKASTGSLSPELSLDLPMTTESFDYPQASELTYIVSWQPEAGGLMGNQVTKSSTTQISLLPGVKYQVRIATNDGPGSYAIEVDTTSGSQQVTSKQDDSLDTDDSFKRKEFVLVTKEISLLKVALKKIFLPTELIWPTSAAIVSASLLILLIVLVRRANRDKKNIAVDNIA